MTGPYFLTVLGLEVKSKMLTNWISGESLQGCLHTWLSSYKDTSPIGSGPHLVISFNLPPYWTVSKLSDAGGVLVSLGSCKQNAIDWVADDNKIYLSHFQSLRNARSRYPSSQVLVRALFQVANCQIFTVSSHTLEQREEASSPVLLIRAFFP